MGSPNPVYSDRLKALGYKIHHETLVKLDGTPFVYNIHATNRTLNESHYETVYDCLNQLIFNRLETECGMVPLTVPIDAQKGEPTIPVLMTRNALKEPRPLLLLLPGSNQSIGYWTGKIAINENVFKGSMLEYTHRAHASGYSVLILNSNQNSVATGQIVRGSEDPVSHVDYVWEYVVRGAVTESVCVVAFSYGGVCIQKLDRLRKLKGVALADSVHHRVRNPVFEKLAVNFKCSDEELGKNLGLDNVGVQTYSSGTSDHGHAAIVAIDEIFKFLKNVI
ncbi:hypothetical protein BCR33DRAFT_723394 [Rhizoclosmatium globosum]|uniref:Arb2 domain-containing protein n=1 Tax=Rhizoclosmatium globosum TaxID=329046 RepID=A0A1Y2BDF2_9FUNG|nr:hypothetical protein BCR33DRAFT_723394 [Rhizoclosmatium globosum]|eukprot:ORY32736.1 hypothetical protein BCR33DRAFT_723394 [Rhizoclosmatium globosum]